MSGVMTFCGRLVSNAARIVSADLIRVSCSDSGVNQAACGVTTRRPSSHGSRARYARNSSGMGSTGGSRGKTSSPAAAIWPSRNKAKSASRSIIGPRAVLTTTAPLCSNESCVCANMPRVSGVNGV